MPHHSRRKALRRLGAHSLRRHLRNRHHKYSLCEWYHSPPPGNSVGWGRPGNNRRKHLLLPPHLGQLLHRPRQGGPNRGPASLGALDPRPPLGGSHKHRHPTVILPQGMICRTIISSRTLQMSRIGLTITMPPLRTYLCDQDYHLSGARRCCWVLAAP